jgi:WXG100 family type VII secretion target
MDTDQADAALNTLRTSHQGLGEVLQKLTAQIGTLEQSWDGSAKQQFLQAWQEWQQAMQQSIEKIQPIIAGLEREKNELIEADGQSNYAG